MEITLALASLGLFFRIKFVYRRLVMPLEILELVQERHSEAHVKPMQL